MRKYLFLSLALTVTLPLILSAQGEPPADWIDPDTGHRVIRLSSVPGTESFYFHQQSFTDKGDILVVSTGAQGAKSSQGKGLAVIDITNLGTKPPVQTQIMEGSNNTPIVGKKTRSVYYVKGGKGEGNSLWATNVDSKVSREIVKLPAGYTGSSGLAINADETLIASVGSDSGTPVPPSDGTKPPPPTQWASAEGKSTQKVLFTVNIQTGEIKCVFTSSDNLNHTQFSPTDPHQILFAHEGTWDNVDRTWTIRDDGTGLKRLHARTMAKEINGHEFFGSDGNWVWYDLQTPRSTVFWLAGVNLKTGERLRYPLQKKEWSVHFNQSHDGKLFAGDGGGPSSVAKGDNGQWIYLFTPKNEPPETLKVGDEDVKIGKFNVERLVNMAKHNYTLEPNNMFTPDDKWIVFRSDLQGAIHTYAVEVKKK